MMMIIMKAIQLAHASDLIYGAAVSSFCCADGEASGSGAEHTVHCNYFPTRVCASS